MIIYPYYLENQLNLNYQIDSWLQQEYYMVSLYLKNNIVKLELGIGKGKKLYDKREDLKKKDSEMYIKKHMND